MVHLPDLITDLALILAVAAVTTLLFRRIHQPVVLGYILAGFLVGPHVSLVPTVADPEGVKTWSEIGVIFLLFTLGLEFSFKKLMKVGGSASVTALVEILLMMILGYYTGRWLGWSTMNSLFLGAILSISSTTIIIRAFEELQVRTTKFAGLVFGVLIIEDLVAIVILVVFSTLGVSRQFEGAELVIELLKLIFFLILWFLAGILFIPTLLERTKKLLNDEAMLIVSIALCLLMVLLAVEVGFSPALGAFIMGSILAETTQAERIEELVKSVKMLFAAVFFISVGMLIDPNVLKEYTLPIIIITLITISGKFIFTTLGALLAGQSLKLSVQAGMSLAQIGEFSFIIAGVGTALSVTDSFLYPIAVTVSAITTFTTPFLIKNAGRTYALLEMALPGRWVRALGRYSSGSQQLNATNDWKDLLNAYMTNAIIQTVIIAAIIFASVRIIQPTMQELMDNPLAVDVTSAGITWLLMVPFIWALAIRRVKKHAYANLWLNRRINRGPLIVLEISRIIVAVVLLGILTNLYFSPAVAILIALGGMTLAILVFHKKLQHFYDRLEWRFLANLNEREKQKVLRTEITPWDAHLATFEVPSEFAYVGKQLQELQLREKFGVNIALIERGSLSILIPSRDERIYPKDILSIIGTDEQLAKINAMFSQFHYVNESNQDVDQEEITLMNVTITPGSRFYNRSIRSTAIREEAKALVVGYERNGQRILNPESTVVLQGGDIVWIVGIKKKIEDFLLTG